jgi:hypothetical protein
MRRSLVGLTGLIVVVIAGLGILLSRQTPAATPSGSHLQTNIVSTVKGTPPSGYGY